MKDDCNQSGFSTIEAVNAHARKEHSLPGTAFKCIQCGHLKPTAGVLATNCVDAHSEERSHRCSECGDMFKQIATLTLHIQRRHGDVVWTCPHCNEVMPLDRRPVHEARARCNEEMETEVSPGTQICGLAECTTGADTPGHMKEHRILHDRCVGCDEVLPLPDSTIVGIPGRMEKSRIRREYLDVCPTPPTNNGMRLSFKSAIPGIKELICTLHPDCEYIMILRMRSRH